jgi:endonuclease/exonuclease/phosphatase family metal-dependent hydrolase
MNKQANAVLARNKIPLKEFHFFPFGVKKLIIEIEAYGIRLYLVHLALQKSVRKKQLEYLASLVKKDGPTIIAGDFNTFSGASELVEFKKKLGLYNPNRRNHPTYPSWHPAKQLDFMLCSKEIRTKNFTVYDVKYSDHLPLLLDFEIT